MRTASARYRKLNEILGEGSYKTVTKAIDEEEGKEVAYNEVRIKRYEEETQTTSSFSKEIALLRNIDHPYILKIFDYWFTEDSFVFITELMTGGTIRDYLNKVGPLNSKLIRKWGRQILEGLKYLHTQEPPIIHRDIKNENVFVNSSQGEIKIGDLGIAKEKKHKRYTIVGTPNFMAREMFEGEGYSEKVDIYALGMSLIEMATGKTPYSEFSDSSDIYRSVLRGVLPSSLYSVQDCCLRSLIMHCLVPCVNRFTAGQCLEHHFFDAENGCAGGCVPKQSTSMFSLSESMGGMELSLISVSGDIITFQILLTDSSRFIKFDYDLSADTLERIAEELTAENIISSGSIETFVELLDRGIKRAMSGRECGQVLTPQEPAVESAEIALQPASAMLAVMGGAGALANPSGSSGGGQMNGIEFGEKTLEAMKEIEEEMLIMGQRGAQNRRADLDGGCINTAINNALRGSAALLLDQGTPGPEAACEQAASVSSRDVSRDSSRDGGLDSPLGSVNSKQLADENAPAELSLSEGYEICKNKYKANCCVSQFAYDAATITGRSEDTAKSWIKALKEEDIESVFDLKLMVYEDWEELPLTVFSARIMQNMLYGVDGVPLKEKQLPMNPEMRDYDNKMSVKDFLTDVCGLIKRREMAPNWNNKLMAQDVRTVAELKSLHQDDWARLGLSVFAHRILKNVIFRKGKIFLE